MSKTSYKSYKWLIDTLYEEPNGYTFPKLQELYSTHRRHEEIEHTRKHEDEDGFDRLKGVSSLERTTFFKWRVQIWKQFGLIIDTPKYDNIYVLTNPQELDSNRTLRELIEHLVKDEKRGGETSFKLPSHKRGRKPSTTMAFSMSWGGRCGMGCDDCPYCDDNEMLIVIRFSMMIGETIVVKQKDITTIEPQQLKLINNRWYVIGYSYLYGGNKEDRKLSVFDVDRLHLCEDEDITPSHYRLIEDFDFDKYIPSDITDNLDPNNVVLLYIRAMVGVLDKNPLSPTQMKMDGQGGVMHNIYKVYTKLDSDFITQYLAYGDELRLFRPPHGERTDIDITDQQMKYLNDLRHAKL